MNVLREAKVKYYQLDTKIFLDNKKLWKAVKLSFSGKVNHANANLFADNDAKEIASSNYQALLLDKNQIGDPVVKAIEKYKYHPSIKRIKQHNIISEKFNFKETSINEIVHQLLIFNASKVAL